MSRSDSGATGGIRSGCSVPPQSRGRMRAVPAAISRNEPEPDRMRPPGDGSDARPSPKGTPGTTHFLTIARGNTPRGLLWRGPEPCSSLRERILIPHPACLHLLPMTVRRCRGAWVEAGEPIRQGMSPIIRGGTTTVPTTAPTPGMPEDPARGREPPSTQVTLMTWVAPNLGACGEAREWRI